MIATDTTIPEVKVFSPEIHSDKRGFFMESYRASWLPAFDFVQDNHSKSVKGTLRGLHYQIKRPQGKLVRVTAGSVFDVAVDLRRSSPFFGKHVSRELSAENKEIFWIPPGFAHGFIVTSTTAEFTYKCTNYYDPADERTLRWNDPELAIKWPTDLLPPLLSSRDEEAPLFIEAEVYN